METKHGFCAHWDEGFPEAGPAKRLKYGIGTGKSLKYDAYDRSRFRDYSSVLHVRKSENGDRMLESISLDKGKNWNFLGTNAFADVPWVDGFKEPCFIHSDYLLCKIEAKVGFDKNGSPPKAVASDNVEYEIRWGRKGKTIHQKRPKGKRVSVNSRQENRPKQVDEYLVLFERQDPKKYPSYNRNRTHKWLPESHDHTRSWFECRDMDQDLRAACKQGGASSVINVLEGLQHGEDVDLPEDISTTAAAASASQVASAHRPCSAPKPSITNPRPDSLAPNHPADKRSKRPKKLRKSKTPARLDPEHACVQKSRDRPSSSGNCEANVDVATSPCGHQCEVNRLSQQCCFCGDRRPIRDKYLQYIDGLGATRCATRHLFYCPTCRARVGSAGTSTSATAGEAPTPTPTPSSADRGEIERAEAAIEGDVTVRQAVQGDGAKASVAELEQRVARLAAFSTSDLPIATAGEASAIARVGVGVDAEGETEAGGQEDEQGRGGSADGGRDNDKDKGATVLHRDGGDDGARDGEDASSGEDLDEAGWITVERADAASEGAGDGSSESSTDDWVEVTA